MCLIGKEQFVCHLKGVANSQAKAWEFWQDIFKNSRLFMLYVLAL